MAEFDTSKVGYTLTIVEAIRARHSVRSYADKKIDKDTIAQIQELIREINGQGNLHLQFLEEAGRTFSKLFNKAVGLGSAPSVIACVGPDDETLEERTGYYGEKIVLAAQRMGLNTCWVGTFHRDRVLADIGPGERLVIVIAVGYGANQGRQHKSKDSAQVSLAEKDRPEWFDFGVKMALLAPTALNRQKFQIRLNEDSSVSFVDKAGVLGKIDLGIVKYHFEVGRKACQNGQDSAGNTYEQNDSTS